MRRFLYLLWQWTWGLPQSLLGLVIFLRNRKRPHFWYHGALATVWDSTGGLGVGMFVFLPKGRDYSRTPRPILVHEYGHTVQSLLLGPLFLPLVGLPSFLWCNLPFFCRLRREKQLSYYAVYPENWANSIGSWAAGEEA